MAVSVYGGAARELKPPTNRRVLPDTIAKTTIDNARKKYGSRSSSASAVDTEPEWLKTAPDMASYGSTGASPSNNYYDDMLDAQMEGANAQTKAALDANNAYIPKVNQYADKRLQDAYILKEQNRVNLPQQLSALGYSGGATETSMLGEMTDYQNNRNAIEQDRSDSLNDIYQNAAQIRATGNANLADLSAQYYQNMINKQAQDEATALSNARYTAESESEAAQTAYENKVQLAKLKAQYGDYSGLTELGISVNALTNGATPTTKKTVTKTTTTPTASGNYNTVLTNVKRALGGSNAGSQRSWDAAINYIQNSMKNGTITEYEAQQMLSQLNLD